MTTKNIINRIIVSVLAVAMIVTVADIGYAGTDSQVYTRNENPVFDTMIEEIRTIEGLEVNVREEHLVKTETIENIVNSLDNNSRVVYDANSECQTVTGDEQAIRIMEDSEGKLAILNEDTNEYTRIETCNNESMIIEKAEKVSNNQYAVSKAVVSLSEESAEIKAAETKGWKKKVTETYQNKYWYQYSSTKKYLRIGCKARYKINLDKLSNSKYDQCKTYVNKINKTSSKWDAFQKACLKFDVSWKIVVAVILAAYAVPETSGLSLIVGVLVGYFAGLTVDGAKEIGSNYIATRKNYNSVKSTYNTIKKYGVQY